MNHLTEQPPLLTPDAVLHRASEHLATRFDGTFSEETVERVVYESYTALARTATISTHLPSLATRFAQDRLTALAQSKGAIAKPVPEVLFVCVQNAGRSQMAAALLRELGGDRVHVRSAGSQPAAHIESSIAQAMGELDIDLAHDFPKPLTDDVVRAADVVITMGCGDACPVYPGKRYLDWHLDDPEQRTIDEVRRIRDEIRVHVEHLLQTLEVPAHE